MQTAQISPTNTNYIDPIISNKEEDRKLINKQTKVINCVLILMALVVCTLLIGGGYSLYKIYIGGKISVPTTDNITTVSPTVRLQISDYSSVKFNSDYIVRNMPNGVTPYKRPQIDLLNRIITMAEQKQWTGNLTDNLGFTYTDFKAEFDYDYNSYKEYIKSKELPAEMVSLLVTSGADQIKTYINEGRDEFLTTISTLGFNQEYIDEINSYVIPKNLDRITYLSGNYNNSNYIGSSTLPVSGDYSRRQINIDPRDIYYVYQDLKNSMFGQRLDENGLIQASTKMVVYHELSHVLMQAFINKHVPLEVKQNGDKNMWSFSDVDFLLPSKDYFWAWGFNKEISDERIAQGLMLKVVAIKYGFSVDEINDLNDVLVEKDNYNMNIIQGIGEILHNQYGRLLSVDWSNLGDYLYSQITQDGQYLKPNADNTILKKMFTVTDMLPGYVGYFNPATDKDWGFFKLGSK